MDSGSRGDWQDWLGLDSVNVHTPGGDRAGVVVRPLGHSCNLACTGLGPAALAAIAVGLQWERYGIWADRYCSLSACVRSRCSAAYILAAYHVGIPGGFCWECSANEHERTKTGSLEAIFSAPYRLGVYHGHKIMLVQCRVIWRAPNRSLSHSASVRTIIRSMCSQRPQQAT